MDGATAPRWRGTARARRRWTESTTAMGGDGWRDGKLRVMEGAARWRGTAQPRWRLDGKGRCDRDGDSTARDGTWLLEEPRERDGDVDVDTAGGGSNKGQRGIEL